MCFIYCYTLSVFTDALLWWRKGVKFLSVITLLGYKWITSSNTLYDGNNSHILKSTTTQFKDDVVSLTTGDVLHHIFALVIIRVIEYLDDACWLICGLSVTKQVLVDRFNATNLST